MKLLLGLLIITGFSLGPADACLTPGLHVRYATSSETLYEVIEVKDAKLSLSYFADAQKKCAQWIAQSPCWTAADLTTVCSALSSDEAHELAAFVERSAVFNLDSRYGGVTPHQRHYAQHLLVKLGEQTREITYESFPDAAPPPEAFEKLRVKLQTMANSLRQTADSDQASMVKCKSTDHAAAK